MSRSISALLALTLCACGGASAGSPSGGSAPPPAAPAPLPLDRDYPRLAELAVKLYSAVADAFRAAGEDCSAATAKLQALQNEYASVVAANARILREGRARDLKPALAKHGDQFEAAAKAIVESATMSKCSQDAAFARAFDELVGSPQ